MAFVKRLIGPRRLRLRLRLRARLLVLAAGAGAGVGAACTGALGFAEPAGTGIETIL